jgi:hypothetical protein
MIPNIKLLTCVEITQSHQPRLRTRISMYLRTEKFTGMLRVCMDLTCTMLYHYARPLLMLSLTTRECLVHIYQKPRKLLYQLGRLSRFKRRPTITKVHTTLSRHCVEESIPDTVRIRQKIQCTPASQTIAVNRRVSWIANTTKNMILGLVITITTTDLK